MNKTIKPIKAILSYAYTAIHGAYLCDLEGILSTVPKSTYSKSVSITNGVAVITLTFRDIDTNANTRIETPKGVADITLKLASNNIDQSDIDHSNGFDFSTKFKEVYLVGILVEPNKNASKVQYLNANGDEVFYAFNQFSTTCMPN